MTSGRSGAGVEEFLKNFHPSLLFVEEITKMPLFLSYELPRSGSFQIDFCVSNPLIMAIDSYQILNPKDNCSKHVSSYKLQTAVGHGHQIVGQRWLSPQRPFLSVFPLTLGEVGIGVEVRAEGGIGLIGVEVGVWVTLVILFGVSVGLDEAWAGIQLLVVLERRVKGSGDLGQRVRYCWCWD